LRHEKGVIEKGRKDHSREGRSTKGERGEQEVEGGRDVFIFICTCT
jgi:hypothetical protein